ncbi:unnamed protein product [Phytophthora fragariaefolia]|uniref:Unnamed protein product n=1 Tax=Phytophthora fragariaefolia TaxID=1490495 RepID=A0A9W6XUA6_9STRA|nr:unnamed protein product [Phytophthora fragariaefolia]
MKGFVPVVVAAAKISSVSGAHEYVNFIPTLTTISNDDTYHMKHVHVVHARVQGDAPVWYGSRSAFASKYGGSSDADHFRGALDSVNTASVEGALKYVQSEGINYNTRSANDRCWRKNGIKWIVFYDIVFAQTNETLAQYEAEYGPYMAMDSGQCTPDAGNFTDTCLSVNGDVSRGIATIGPFIGGKSRDDDPRAPYPNCWWYSFPNSCILKKWPPNVPTKDDQCRADTRRGLCEFDKLPDGITCTYNYRILGYVPIDDVVGITNMKDSTGANYADFSQFCQDGNVEFNAKEDGVWIESIPFWMNPQDASANAERAQKVLDAYSTLLTSGSTQIAINDVAKMQSLPVVADLTKENPPCYENDKACANAPNGCKRDLFSQICTICSSSNEECIVAPSSFTFPTLAKATVPENSATSSQTGSTSATSSQTGGSTSSDESTPTPTPTSATIATTSDAEKMSAAVCGLIASLGIFFLMA